MPSETPIKNTTQQKTEIDIGRLVGEIIDHRKLIISVVAIFAMISLVYVLFATPVYQANALVQVEQKQGNAILDSLTQALPTTQPKSDPEISLLLSRMILGKTVDDLNLQAQIEENHFPIFGKGLSRITGQADSHISVSNFKLIANDKKHPKIELEVVDNKSFVITNDDEVIKGSVGELIEKGNLSIKVDHIDAVPGTAFDITYLSKLEAINNIQNSFKVEDQGRDTGMLNLTLTGEDPILIKRVLDSISKNYLEQNIDRQAAQDAKSLEFLSKQLPKVRFDLDKAENILNAYRQKKDSVDLSLEAKSVLDQVVNVDNQLNELVFREAEISQLYTKEHPTYKALVEKRETLNQERARLNKRVASMPETQQEILRLSRDVESGQAVYMQLLNRQQELSIAKSSAIGNVRIIDPAVTEPTAVKPQKIAIIAIGIIAGLFVSGWIILLRVLLRKGIDSPTQLEENGINVYASVPISEWLYKNGENDGKVGGNKTHHHKNYGLLAVENPADLAIEAIRSLRTSLHFAMLDAVNNVLMISGASPNAGKTFVSSNLAAVMAQGDRKVIFIDADLRKGYAHKIFGLPNDVGLSEYLSGSANINNVVKRVEFGQFDFISRGTIPPNPAELLMRGSLEVLIEWASKNYDLVIVDTPPVLAVTDPTIISRCAGTTLMVIRHEVNTLPEVEAAIKRFEMNNVNVKGVILNAVVKRATNYYAYGYNSYTYDYTDKAK